MIAELFSHRWALPVGDANHLGFLAAVVLPLGVACSHAIRIRAGSWRWSVLPVLVVIAAGLVLVATRSRSAWLAAVAGLGLLVCLGTGRALRLSALGLLMLLAVAVLVEPKAAGRAATLLEPSVNPSSQQRATLWQAALVTAWDHPWAGVADGFTAAYNDWFRPADDPWPRPTALSDVLQLACTCGIPATAAVAAAVAALMLALIGRARLRDAPWSLGLAASLLGAWTCSCLTALVLIPWCCWVLAALVVLALVWAWRDLLLWPSLRVVGLTALAVHVILLLAGGILARDLAFRPQGRACVPRHAVPDLALAVRPDPANTPAETTRWILRPLAEAGIAAYPAEGAPPDLPLLVVAARHPPSSAPVLVCIDMDPAQIGKPATPPVLALLGRRDPEWRYAPPPTVPEGVHLRWLPWGRTWPHRFPDAIPAIVSWLRVYHGR